MIASAQSVDSDGVRTELELEENEMLLKDLEDNVNSWKVVKMDKGTRVDGAAVFVTKNDTGYEADDDITSTRANVFGQWKGGKDGAFIGVLCKGESIAIHLREKDGTNFQCIGWFSVENIVEVRDRTIALGRHASKDQLMRVTFDRTGVEMYPKIPRVPKDECKRDKIRYGFKEAVKRWHEKDPNGGVHTRLDDWVDKHLWHGIMTWSRTPPTSTRA